MGLIFKKLYMVVLLVFSTILFFSACEDNTVAPLAEETIQGIVSDLDDNPVANAAIEALTNEDEVIKSVLSDEAGNFSLTFKPKDADNTFIRIKHKDFHEIKENMKDFKKNNTQEKKKYYLQNGDDTCCGKVTIIAKIKDTDSVIKDVQVKLSINGQLKRVATTNGDGAVVFNRICAAEYGIRLYHSSFKVIEEELTIGECDTLTVYYGMERKDSICCNSTATFTIKNSEGQKIDSALVKLYVNGQVIRDGKTNSDGQITFNELCEGKIGVAIIKSGMKPIEFTFEVGCDGNYTFEKTMQRAEDNDCCGTIIVFVIDSTTNSPLKNAEVRLTKGGQLISKYYTSENGTITFTKVCKGDYGLRIALDSYNVIEKQISANTNCDSIAYTAIMKKKQNSDTCCNNVLKVKVRDSTDYELLNNVKVALWKGGKIVKYAYTENGIVTISNICEGSYGVSITIDGYKGLEFETTFGCSQTIEMEKKLVPLKNDSCCAVIKFIVLDNTTNSPLKNAEVKLTKANTDIKKVLYTDENGLVTFRELCDGNYWVRIAKEGYKVKEQDGFKVDTCDEQSFTMKLEANPKIDTCCDNSALFKVKDTDGNLITGALVKVMKGGQVIYYDSTSQGEYQTSANLCTGTYTFLITYKGKEVTDGSFTVSCNQTATITKVIEKAVCCTAKIQIFPKDSVNNEPINGAKVKLWKGGNLIKTLTVENGSVKFVEVCEGEYQISISHDSFKGAEFNVVAECDKLKEYTKYLGRK